MTSSLTRQASDPRAISQARLSGDQPDLEQGVSYVTIHTERNEYGCVHIVETHEAVTQQEVYGIKRKRDFKERLPRMRKRRESSAIPESVLFQAANIDTEMPDARVEIPSHSYGANTSIFPPAYSVNDPSPTKAREVNAQPASSLITPVFSTPVSHGIEGFPFQRTSTSPAPIRPTLIRRDGRIYVCPVPSTEIITQSSDKLFGM